MKISLYLLAIYAILRQGSAVRISPSTRSISAYGAFAIQQRVSNYQISAIMRLRGGDLAGSDEEFDEDEYDDDDDDDIDNAEEDEATAMHQQRRDQQRKRPVVDGRGRHKAPYIPRKKKPKNALSQLASTSLKFSKQAALTTVQTSGKAAYYLMRPKSIQRKELTGLWRLDQQVGLEQSTATVEFTSRGLVIVRDDTGIVWKAPYTFVQPTWPQSCRVEFEARAFQPNTKKKQKQPWLLFYRGYLERKVADSKVIKIVGKLYEIDRPKSMFGKELPPKYTKIGSFVGRKRVMIQEEDEEDEYDDEEDEEEEEEGEEDPRYHPRSRRSRREVDEEEDEEDFDEYDDDEL